MPDKGIYTLTRRLPSGEEKAWPMTFGARLAAARTAARCLVDNGAASKAGAQRWCTELTAAPDGDWREHPSGYAFRIHITR